MSSRAEAEKQRQIQDKCQTILGNLLREEDNKYCVDCDAKGPRWASWNLGIFLCIRCAGIHRNLGVHISKVKSVNLDTWTPEQVAFLQQMGNSQARAVYEANLPDNFRRPQTDSSLEAFVRAKYEQKKYIAKEWVPPPAPKPAFDIDEDKKRERERKKSRGKATNNAVEIPTLQQPSALPRPHSAGALSPSPITVTPEVKTSQPQQQSSNTEDLLSLDVSNVEQSDDPFDAFLSAPLSTATTSNSTTPSQTVPNESTSPSNKTSDEADFFNQTGVLDASKTNKMTKESILSLYGTGGAQPQSTQPQPPIYGLPGGMYVAPQIYLAPNMTGIQAPTAQAVIPNGIATIGPQIPGIQPSGINIAAVCNPFATMGASVMTQDVSQHSGSWISSPAGGGTNPALMAQGFGQDFFGHHILDKPHDLMGDVNAVNCLTQPQVYASMSFTNTSNKLIDYMTPEHQLQQQMASLQISGQAWNVQGVAQVPATGMVVGGGQPAAGMSWPTASHGQTLSTNLWQ